MAFPRQPRVLIFLVSLHARSSRLAATRLRRRAPRGCHLPHQGTGGLSRGSLPSRGLVPLLRRHSRAWLWLLPVVGFTTVFAVETLVYFWSSGELLHRFRAIATNQSAAVSQKERQLQSLWLYPRTMFLVVGSSRAYVSGTLPAWLSSPFRRQLRTPGLIVAWLLLPFLYLQFGSTSLTSYNLLPSSLGTSVRSPPGRDPHRRLARPLGRHVEPLVSPHCSRSPGPVRDNLSRVARRHACRPLHVHADRCATPLAISMRTTYAPYMQRHSSPIPFRSCPTEPRAPSEPRLSRVQRRTLHHAESGASRGGLGGAIGLRFPARPPATDCARWRPSRPSRSTCLTLTAELPQWR